jgi:hypothetical protein
MNFPVCQIPFLKTTPFLPKPYQQKNNHFLQDASHQRTVVKIRRFILFYCKNFMDVLLLMVCTVADGCCPCRPLSFQV